MLTMTLDPAHPTGQRIHILERLAATAIALHAVELEMTAASRPLLHDALDELRSTIIELRGLLTEDEPQESADDEQPKPAQ
jgi:HPt (histidine-containing phosphotransfer) domain-containing protein